MSVYRKHWIPIRIQNCVRIGTILTMNIQADNSTNIMLMSTQCSHEIWFMSMWICVFVYAGMDGMIHAWRCSAMAVRHGDTVVRHHLTPCIYIMTRAWYVVRGDIHEDVTTWWHMQQCGNAAVCMMMWYDVATWWHIWQCGDRAVCAVMWNTVSAGMVSMHGNMVSKNPCLIEGGSRVHI